MPTASLLKKLLRSIPLGRKADPALRAAVAADDPAAFQEAFLAMLAKPVKRLRRQLGNRPLLAAWSVDAVDLSGRERELAASLDELSSRAAKHATAKHRKSKGKKGKQARVSSKYDEVISNWLVEVGTARGRGKRLPSPKSCCARDRRCLPGISLRHSRSSPTQRCVSLPEDCLIHRQRRKKTTPSVR